MTNQIKLIAGAVVVIVIIGIGGFLMMSKSKTPQTTTNVTQETTQQQQSATKGSIKSLLGAGKNVMCTIKYPEAGSSGTVYVAGEKVRGDFTVTAEGKSMESHMIQDGQFGYFWTGAQGTKMKIDAVATPSPVAGTTQSQTANLDEEVEMDCSNWGVDNSKFTAPADVKFMDLTQTMMQTQQQTQQKDTNQSNVCETITDPQAKAACVSALGN